jgi:DNA-binding transcriptional LysR family regulator
VQLAAVRSGFGIGRAPDVLAQQYSELRPVLADQYQVVVGLWVVMHEDARNIPRVRAMFDHLATALRAVLATSNAKLRRQSP